MISEYHRPKKIEDAVQLLLRTSPSTIPLAGGSTITHLDQDFAVVDLQDLLINQIRVGGNQAEIGAMTTFQQLMEWDAAPAIVVESAHLSATYNQRNQVTIGGAIAVKTASSAMLAVLLALDVKLVWEPGGLEVSLGDWLPLRDRKKPGVLITQVMVPINVETAMEVVARTPADTPQILVCGCKWSSGRVRLVSMLKNHLPKLLSDGRDAEQLEQSAMNADLDSKDYSPEYIQHAYAVLVNRVRSRLVD